MHPAALPHDVLIWLVIALVLFIVAAVMACVERAWVLALVAAGFAAFVVPYLVT